MARRVINGAAVRALREALGIRQDVLAGRAGMSKSALSHVERGDYGVSPEATRRLADELGVPLDAITVPVPATAVVP